MIKATLILSIVLFSFQIIFGQDTVHTYEDENIKCTYHLTQGRFNGNYTSYYKNGVKKSEGNFDNNLRTGKWSVWDSLGNLRMVRDYSDQFTFELIEPKVPDDKLIQLLNVPRYKIEYNSDGYIKYVYVEERDVYYSKRMWRYLSAENNPILFDNQRLFRIIHKQILDSNLSIYSCDRFREEINIEIDTNSFDIIGFKLEDDFFYNLDLNCSETRTIGISPVAVSKVKNDTIDLFWVYLPYLRKYLAQEMINNYTVPEKIKSLDDLFFFRYFNAPIYYVANVWDRSKIVPLVFNESEKKEISLIETEHDLWKSLTSNPE